MRTTEELESFAQRMRLNPTPEEKAFGEKLEPAGIIYLPQQVIGPYIVDFAIPGKMTVIELDGIQHTGNKGYDNRRDTFLANAGFKVYRLWNSKAKHWNLAEVAALPDARRPSAYRDAVGYADLLMATGKGYDGPKKKSVRVKPINPNPGPVSVKIENPSPEVIRRRRKEQLKRVVRRILALELEEDKYEGFLIRLNELVARVEPVTSRPIKLLKKKAA